MPSLHVTTGIAPVWRARSVRDRWHRVRWKWSPSNSLASPTRAGKFSGIGRRRPSPFFNNLPAPKGTLVAHVKFSICDRWIGSDYGRQQLCPCQRLELLGRCCGEHQPAVLPHQQQAAAGQSDRARAEAIDIPLHLAGFQLHAAQALPVFLPAVITVKVAVAIDRGGVVARERVIRSPKLLDASALNFEQRGAGSIARREEHQAP